VKESCIVQSEFHASGRGKVAVASSPFSVLDDAASYAAAVDEFLTTPSSATVPVWTDGRADLAASVERAVSLYAEVSRPAARMYGVLLKPEALPAGLVSLIEPCASTWLDEAEVGPMLDQPGTQEAPGTYRERDASDGAGRRGVRSLVIAGLYENFTVDLLWPVLRVAAHRPDVRLTFLTGRDAASLAWFTAKQYVRPAPDVCELGLFTSSDRGLTHSGIHLRDEQGVQTADIRSELLGTRWRRLLLQGHGKDDSLNLAEFTVCGLNETVRRDPALLAPLCAHAAEPTCYKPVDKLIQLREICAAEVVLSSCNNAPFADAAIYDPKYQLMLSAVDGTAKDVVAAITVHGSDRAENRAWIEAALVHASSVTALNSSIVTTQPFPAYVHFGMGDDEGVTPEQPSLVPDPLLITTSTRLTAYLAGGLLSPNNPLRSRFGKLAAKVENLVSRRSLATQERTTTTRSLLDDLQSLDQAIAVQFVEDPENDLSNCPGYFASRSRLDPSSLTHVRCQCGRPAERYAWRALVPTVLDTEGTVCMRCGDVVFRLPDAPFLLVHANEDVAQGGTLHVRVEVRNARPGAIRVGLHVASYGRAFCTVTPTLRKARVRAEGDCETEFTLTLTPDVLPHAYHMTAIAVQDLAVTKVRRHFGIVPAHTVLEQAPSD
jgi:hypothetical protein